jgi:hypothetical protein
MVEYAHRQDGTASDQASESNTDADSAPERPSAAQPAAFVATSGVAALVTIAGVSLAEMGLSDPGAVLLAPIARTIHSLLPREEKAYAKPD